MINRSLLSPRKSMEEYLVSNLQDPRAQKFILAGILFIGLFYCYYALVYKKQANQIELLEVRLNRIERHVEDARRRVERHNIDSLKAELSSLEDQLKVLERLLPTAEEVPDLLEMVERKGIRSGINAILFEPGESRESQFYKEQVYKVSVRGGYHDIGRFLAKVGSSPRVVKTSRMILVPQRVEGRKEERSVVANFELSTFILPEANTGENVQGNEKNG